MKDQADGYVTADGRQIGPVVMEMKNITLRFGGVEAIKDISLDIREGEIRAIIGPNGAGKSSMLNRDQRVLCPAGWRSLVQRVASCGNETVSGRPAGHRADIPEHCPV